MPQIVAEFRARVSDKDASDLRSALNKVIRLQKADMGNIQVFDVATGILHLLIQKGFSEDFVSTFKEVHPFDSTACGRAIGMSRSVFIANVQEDVSFRHFLPVINFQSVVSMPVMNQYDKRLGVISTHFLKRPDSYHSALPELTRRVATTLQSILDTDPNLPYFHPGPDSKP